MVLVFVALFLLSLTVCLWSTIFAFLEYRHEREQEFDAFLVTVVEEMSLVFLEPIVLDHAEKFIQQLSRDITDAGPAGPDTGNCTARNFFLRLQLVRILSGEEFDSFVSLCLERAQRQKTCFTRRQIRLKLLHLCSLYVWKSTDLDDLFSEYFD